MEMKMSKSKTCKSILLAAFILGAGCKERYIPKEIATNYSYLVVDGFLNAGNDTTTITLTRSKTLEDKNSFYPELSAQVRVEEEGSGNMFTLDEIGNGKYQVPLLPLNPSRKYRLNIRISNGGVYQSDFVVVKNSPPIDSISWDQNEEGVTIYANTHDPQDSSRYYRFEYTETWEHHAEYSALYDYKNGAVVYIADPDSNHYKCWTTQRSTDILLASTARLDKDVLYKFPLRKILRNAEEISVKYSTIVTQYVLTEDGYQYWNLLKKNTEELGSIFGPQPSQQTGNIHCISNPEEPVMGYLSATTGLKKRIYINNNEVLPWQYPRNCQTITVDAIPDSIQWYFGMLGYSPIDSVTAPPGKKYNASQKPCVYCTFTGGTTTKPSFWP
ncbi:MAG: DUF4249 domain-containing protein [Bacteroidetes bacterium]|nr:MAG: DUF4249 domain-containing protein [Bacteroidota bacterium]